MQNGVLMSLNISQDDSKDLDLVKPEATELGWEEHKAHDGRKYELWTNTWLLERNSLKLSI